MIENLPETWAAVRLSEICQINPRGRPDLRDDDEVSFIPMSAVDELSGTIVSAEVRLLRDVRTGFTPFLDGDVLFAKITPCMENGKAAIARRLANGAGYGSTEFHVLRPSALVLAEWIFALLRTKAFRQAAASTYQGAVGQQRVPAAFLESFRFPLPPISEQRRIVEILEEADEIRRLRVKADAQLSKLVPAIFERAFGDPIGNSKGWPVLELGTLIRGTPKNGLYKPSDQYGDGTPIIRIGDFANGCALDVSQLQRVRLNESEVEQFHVANGQILINRVNSIEHLGKSVLVSGLVEPTVYESNMMRLIPASENVEAEFLINCFQHPSVLSKLRAKAKKAINQASINQSDILGLRIAVPPIQEQQTFRKHVTEIQALDKLNDDTSRVSISLLASISARAFSGQLTVQWREKHAKQLEKEARDRDYELAMLSGKEVMVNFSAAPPDDDLATFDLPDDLNSEQQSLLLFIRMRERRRREDQRAERDAILSNLPSYFTAERLASEIRGPLRKKPQAIEAHLVLLAVRGIIVPVSREEQTPDTGEWVFGNAYRLPRGIGESPDERPSYRATIGTGASAVSEPIPGDRCRLREMERLVFRLEREAAHS